jgi:hypothetical protein
MNASSLVGLLLIMMVVAVSLQIAPDKMHLIASAIVAGGLLGAGLARWMR